MHKHELVSQVEELFLDPSTLSVGNYGPKVLYSWKPFPKCLSICFGQLVPCLLVELPPQLRNFTDVLSIIPNWALPYPCAHVTLSPCAISSSTHE